MAITLQNSAPLRASVNNEMLFVVYESTKVNDPVTYKDYSYVCDVYVSGNLVERLIARPDPIRKMGVFDVSKALQPYAVYDFNPANTITDYSIMTEYQLHFGEQYNGTLYTNILVDNEREAYPSYKPAPFTDTTVLNTGKASNMPAVVNNSRQSPILYNYFSSVSGVNDFELLTYDKAGTLLSTTNFDNTDYNYLQEIRQYNIGQAASNVNAEYAILRDKVSLVQLQRVNYICTKHSPITLAWLNPYGGYDSQTFSMVSKKTIQIAKKEFNKLHYNLTPSGVVSYMENDVFLGGKRHYSSLVDTRMQLTSHLLTDAEYKWLADLFISPSVFMYFNNTDIGVADTWFPVTLNQNDYEYRTYKNSRLTPLQFEVMIGHNYNGQYL